MEQSHCIKSCLLSFLLKGSKVEQPELKARIVNKSPIQITDDGVNYLEINELEDDILRNIKDLESPCVILKSWNFVLKRVPNSADYYLDVRANKFS